MPTPAAAPFSLVRQHTIESLGICVEEYEHKDTGATHIHLNAENDENVFLVALRTVPKDSTGVAHILEHTALCGSEKYPVRDPFFMMIRRSLNTFMNAFTSSDWTAYPFASQNKKDFNNLLDVYLDAVFFSKLDPLDFAQEGHRVEFEEPNNTESPLVFKGVVFNEMKGAMSSINSQLWQTLCKYLFPTNTYHYNSGGDPESIPDLSYDQLKAFYKTHYHPSNAIFMTFGNIPAAEHQKKFESQALNRFSKLNDVIAVPAEKRYQAPIKIEEAYPFNENNEDGNNEIHQKTHIVMGWLLGKSTNLEEALEAQLLTSVLLENSASPLQHVLETTDLANSPSPLCGLDDSQYELSFICGIEGSEAEKSDAFETLVLDTLKTVAAEGVPLEDVEAALHQLELQQREISGDSYPYGLQLILTALSAATHRGNPIGLLDIDPVLNKLRKAIKDPNYIKDLVQRLLLDNPHRVRLTMVPNQDISARKIEAEKQRLAQLKASLSDTQLANIVNLTNALQERQNSKDDISILPKVGLEDIPPHIHHVKGEIKNADSCPIAVYSTGTNGLVYQQAIVDIPELTETEYQILSFYCVCISELGFGDMDYLSAQKKQTQIVGSLNAYSSIRSHVDNTHNTRGHIILSAKALAANHQQMTQLMADAFYNIRFDEISRIKELIGQIRARREQSVTGNGHGLAMSAASAAMSALSQLNHNASGLAGIQYYKTLDQHIKEEKRLTEFANQLGALHQKIIKQPMQFLIVSDETNVRHQHQYLHDFWQTKAKVTPAVILGGDCQLPSLKANQIRQAWQTHTQVNFCAKAYPTVPMTHPDAPALTVLGGVLRNGHLHRVIREQGGAYGGGAQQDNNIAAFRFYSYRDPRLENTLKDFDQSIAWLLETKHEWLAVEEAILGVVSSIDKPGSPAGEAKQAFHAELNGRTLELREGFRQGILQVTEKDLKRVTETYLADSNKASIAVVTSPENAAITAKLNLEAVKL